MMWVEVTLKNLRSIYTVFNHTRVALIAFHNGVIMLCIGPFKHAINKNHFNFTIQTKWNNALVIFIESRFQVWRVQR
jgi:hypothetical protein